MKKQATKPRKTAVKKRVETITHGKQSRLNNPTAEMEGLVAGAKKKPVSVDYPRKHSPKKTPAHYERNADLDPQLVWTGKDEEDKKDLHVDAMPIYVQEKVQPLAIIEDLQRRPQQAGDTGNLFADFNGLSASEGVQFYQHAQKWTNRMILGDSLKVMTSLARKEKLKGKVQCVYIDPPYGIRFRGMWQTTTRIHKVRDEDESHEPEMIRAFRDTWKLGIHSYLSYLRDRLVAAHDLLTESGSVFLQIGSQNVHLVRCLLDEVFGPENFVAEIILRTRNTTTDKYLSLLNDYILWFAKDKDNLKFRRIFDDKEIDRRRFKFTDQSYDGKERFYVGSSLFSTSGDTISRQAFSFRGEEHTPTTQRGWRTAFAGLENLNKADRIFLQGSYISYKYYHDDFPVSVIGNLWEKQMSEQNKIYVVQTAKKAIQRCILMSTDPGDIVLDPTCGSGATASVAEQWGRRWITCDTSRVALAIARSRLMNSVYPYYLLKDSKEGADMEAKLSKQPHGKTAFTEDVRQGFVYERVPHITLRAVANNTEISEIHAHYQDELEILRKKLNAETKNNFAEWEIPRDIPEKEKWSKKATDIHAAWWKARIARQQKIDESITKNADMEMLVDCPCKVRNTVRVTGPFTVESLSPHRIIPPSDTEDSSDIRPISQTENESRFWDVIYENLKISGVQNTRKGEHLKFTELEPWPGGELIQFAGRYLQKNDKEKKVAVCVGPEYDTVTRTLLIDAAREAADMFDMLVVLGFAFEAYADESMASLGNLVVWRVRMNNDLHMGERLASRKIDGSNLFVSLGEPDINCRLLPDDMIEVEISGIDIFNPTTGELTANKVGEIACWMIDTDYNGQSFFVRHAYFCGDGKDPHKELKRALKAEISDELWDTLRASVSRPFAKPKTGKIAVKAINHHGDEVMKVFSIT